MAPMMTAVEFVLRPTEAIRIAHTMTHMFVPVIFPPEISRSRISSWEAVSSVIEKRLLVTCLHSWKKPFLSSFSFASGRERSSRICSLVRRLFSCLACLFSPPLILFSSCMTASFPFRIFLRIQAVENSPILYLCLRVLPNCAFCPPYGFSSIVFMRSHPADRSEKL